MKLNDLQFALLERSLDLAIQLLRDLKRQHLAGAKLEYMKDLEGAVQTLESLQMTAMCKRGPRKLIG